MNKLPERIKELREENNLTQVEFCKKINVSQPTVARWESGERVPTLEFLIILAKFFKCSIDYLVGLED